MTRIEVDALHGENRATRERLHETQTLADGVHHVLVLLRKRRVLHEIEIPIFWMMEISEPPVDKRADEIQRQRTAFISSKEQGGIGRPRRKRELWPIYIVPTKTRQLDALARLQCRAARLRVLACKAPDANDPFARPVNKHETHLQKNLEPRGNRCGSAIREVLRTITAPKYEPFTTRCFRKRPFERLDFVTRHQWWKRGQFTKRLRERCRVRVVRLLHRWSSAP